MKPQNERRHFIRNMLIMGLGSGMIPPLLSGCQPLLKTMDGSEDLKKLQTLIADKKNPLKWIFTGDSITEGAKHTLGYRSYPEIFSEHIRFEMNRSRDFVINTAISGNATPDILGDFEWRIGQFHPQVVSLMIGTNDAAISRKISINDFENNVLLLVQKFRDLGAIPILQTPNTINVEAPAGRERAQLNSYVEALRKVADRQKVILIDHWNYWQKNNEKSLQEKWLADPLHPNGKGHLEMARLMFQALSICDASSFTCSGNVNF